MPTTGWPPGLLQDDSRELSRWLSTRLGARYQIQRNNMPTNQTPEELAEECKRLANQLGATSLDRSTEAELRDAINRLRDMAASGAKDAERYQAIRSANEGSGSEDLCLCVVKNVHFDFVSSGAELDNLADTAIAATKRGGV